MMSHNVMAWRHVTSWCCDVTTWRHDIFGQVPLMSLLIVVIMPSLCHVIWHYVMLWRDIMSYGVTAVTAWRHNVIWHLFTSSTCPLMSLLFLVIMTSLCHVITSHLASHNVMAWHHDVTAWHHLMSLDKKTDKEGITWEGASMLRCFHIISFSQINYIFSYIAYNRYIILSNKW